MTNGEEDEFTSQSKESIAEDRRSYIDADLKMRADEEDEGCWRRSYDPEERDELEMLEACQGENIEQCGINIIAEIKQELEDLLENKCIYCPKNTDMKDCCENNPGCSDETRRQYLIYNACRILMMHFEDEYGVVSS